MEDPAVSCSGVPLSAAEHSVLNNIGRAAKACLPAPDCAAEYPDGALCELLKSRDIYDVDSVAPAAAYDPSRVKILRGETRPKLARGLFGRPRGRGVFG